jgi:hypothetical protein
VFNQESDHLQVCTNIAREIQHCQIFGHTVLLRKSLGPITRHTKQHKKKYHNTTISRTGRHCKGTREDSTKAYKTKVNNIKKTEIAAKKMRWTFPTKEINNKNKDVPKSTKDKVYSAVVSPIIVA